MSLIVKPRIQWVTMKETRRWIAKTGRYVWEYELQGSEGEEKEKPELANEYTTSLNNIHLFHFI